MTTEKRKHAAKKPTDKKKTAAAKAKPKPAKKSAAPKTTTKAAPTVKPAVKKPAVSKPAAKKTLEKKTPEKKTPAAKPAPSLGDRICGWIDADKGEEIVTIDLAGKSAMADAMVIASGRSSRHVAAMAEHIIENLKKSGAKVARAEGMARGDWVLIDAGDVIVHLFRPEVRKFYALEKLWNLDETGPDQVAVKP